MVALMVLTFIVLFLTVDYLSGSSWRSAPSPVVAAIAADVVLPTGPEERARLSELVSVPPDVFLAPGHVWIRLDPTGSIRVGVDRVLLELLGGLERLYPHEAGSDVRNGGPLIMLRHGQRALKVRSPVAGRVTRVNTRLAEHPDEVVADPFGAWLYEIRPDDLGQALKPTVVAEAAHNWMRGEMERLREALQRPLGDDRAALPSLADGGLPARGFSSHLDDARWEQLISDYFSRAR